MPAVPGRGSCELAYFTGDGVLMAAVPRFVAGPRGAGKVAVGLVVGAFSLVVGISSFGAWIPDRLGAAHATRLALRGGRPGRPSPRSLLRSASTPRCARRVPRRR